MSNLETMYPAQANSPYTTTLGEIAPNDTAVVVADASVLPGAVPFLLTLGYDKSASETVLVTAVSNNTLTITRGVDGNALLWVAGTKAARIFTAKDLNDVQANLRRLNQDKQENLTFDTTPTAGSTNPVTSGGIREALNLKANAASLASHTGNTNNPHGVTAAQVGAATPESVAAAIGEVSSIGDMKTTLATPGEKWLACDGSGVNSTAYPDLVPILQAGNPLGKRLEVTTGSEIFYSKYPWYYHMYGQCAYYYDGYWIIACTGYKTYSPSAGQDGDMYTPVLYITKDIYGSWQEIRLSTDKYHLTGVLYNSRWGDWVAYGYKYVSDTECYPYIFYTGSDPTKGWTAKQVSTTKCKISAALYANNQLVLMGKGCGDDNSTNGYAFVGASYSISFTENNFTTEFAYSNGVRGLAYGNGYWAFADNGGAVWYAADPTGVWTKNTIISSGVQLRDICYGGSTWCVSGMQNSGGYGRMFYATDVTSSFVNYGVLGTDGLDMAAYCDGVFLCIDKDLGSSRKIHYSLDNCVTWTTKSVDCGNAYDMVGHDGKWLVAGMYAPYVLRQPQFDAALPELAPELGTTYIKAEN